jgi:hypothetical protein
VAHPAKLNVREAMTKNANIFIARQFSTLLMRNCNELRRSLEPPQQDQPRTKQPAYQQRRKEFVQLTAKPRSYLIKEMDWRVVAEV